MLGAAWLSDCHNDPAKKLFLSILQQRQLREQGSTKGPDPVVGEGLRQGGSWKLPARALFLLLGYDANNGK